ncbi:TPA: hypothetical protein DCX16_01680 [bacterium]|nr:hypothetical protein [bacterium]
MEEEKLHRLCNILVIITIFLVAIGLIMVFSASSIRIPQSEISMYHYFLRQTLWAAIGFLALLIVSRIDCNWLFKNSFYILLFCLLLTVCTLCFPPINNARRWLIIGPLSIQPSELLKVAFIIYLSSFFSKKDDDKLKIFLHGFFPPIIILAIILAILALQPHCGAAIFISFIFLSMAFFGRVRIKYILLFFIFVGISIGTIITTKSYVMERIVNMDNYQSQHSIIALGSGGIFGKGPGLSEQKLFTLPLPYTDFILPIIGEELGFLGVLFIICLFVLFAIIGFSISVNLSSIFGSLLVFGLVFSIFLQAIINMCVVSKLIPVMGLPLPFISYGGSFLVSSLISIGLIINLTHSSSKIKDHFP